MLTPEQLKSVEKAISICKRNHQREVCALIDYVSDYEPQSRVTVSNIIEGYLSQVADELKVFEKELKKEVIRVTRIVCPTLGKTEKERISRTAEGALDISFYEKRFPLICEAVVRHYSRFGIKINLEDYRLDLIEACHMSMVRNKVQEIKETIDNELSLFVTSAPVADNQTNSSWHDAFHLKPNIFGMGVNLNYIISKLWRNKK